MPSWTLLCLPTLLTAVCAAPPVTDLQANYRDGQIFLTWREAPTPAGTTFNVYVAKQPLTPADLTAERRIAHHVEPHSARDWWQDPASFDAKAPAGEPAGFVIEAGAAPLDPSGGLFVYTITPETAGPLWFAVTSSDGEGQETTDLIAGANLLAEPITGQVAPVRAIWVGDGEAPAAGSGQGKRLVLSLHGRGGGVTAAERPQTVNYLLFGDASQGWREGLSAKFQIHVGEDQVSLIPSDRTWVNRPVTESGDGRDHVPAINTWWYGYRADIHQPERNEPPVVPNYSERRLLAMIRWAEQELGVDPNQVILTGGSMGGSGSVALAMHYPELYAAVGAQVPVVSMTERGGRGGSLSRLTSLNGPLNDAVTGEGEPLIEHFNGERLASREAIDLPPMFITNGRTDASIPWPNNPPFYRAMQAARQALFVHWNNEGHGDAHRLAPDDVKNWWNQLDRFALDRSYPVFTNNSDDKNPGNGDPTDGDIVGWINRGLDWRDIVDTADEYAITISAAHPDITYPVTLDLTPRRRQQFRPAAGTALQAQVGDAAPVAVTVDELGLFTVPGIRLAGPDGVRVRVTRK